MNVKKHIYHLAFAAAAVVLSTTSVSAQMDKMGAQSKKVSELPNISVIGNAIATHSGSNKAFDLKEIEIAFQHYLYPTIKADIFTTFHKEESGERVFELEEAYLSFFDVVDTIIPNLETGVEIGGTLGKKLVNFGKQNSLHPEQWAFVDRPLAYKQFLGEAEGLSGEGASLSYLLPVPFFSQFETGYWSPTVHAHEEGEEEGHGVEYSSPLWNARLWNSIEISDNQELEIGASYLVGNAFQNATDEQQDILGVDATFHHVFDNGQKAFLQAEWLQANYGEEGEERETQSGTAVQALYELSPYFNTAVRYDMLGKHGDEGEETSQFSVILTRQLTETSKFRVQYSTGENVDQAIYIQMLFGMGPHSHVLN